MPKVIKLRKGLDIKLEGVAEKILTRAGESELYALVPSDYVGVTPKLLLKEGDDVKAGSPVFFDKQNPAVIFSSPVSGTIKEIRRGDKRKILAITILPDGKKESLSFEAPKNPTAEQAKEYLLQAGLWAMLIQRPFGIMAKPETTPRDIYVSAFDTSPLAPDMEYILQDQRVEIEIGIEFLGKIAPVHLGVEANGVFTTIQGANVTQFAGKHPAGNVGVQIANTKPIAKGAFTTIQGANVTQFAGKHPAGNVGVQIANTKPIAKGDIIWTLDIQHLAIIGRTLMTGKIDMTKTVAVAGSEVKKPHYVKCVSGAAVASILKDNVNGNNARFISGNPLTGTNVGPDGFLGFYHNQITLLPEGDYHEFIGWAMPRLNKFSVSRSYFSWLSPGKKYNLDTNLNGGERAFVMNGIYENVLPMDIYPVYLIKAVMAMDIDKMENFGIYEVIEEDLALCEFICPSKIEWQAILRDGITKMIKEL